MPKQTKQIWLSNQPKIQYYQMRLFISEWLETTKKHGNVQNTMWPVKFQPLRH